MVPVTEVHDDVAVPDATEEAVELRRPSPHMSFERIGVRHASESALQG
jgi:hypothetical protein